MATQLTTLAAYVDTEVAAIKAKTDNLPVDPADASDIGSTMTIITNSLSSLSTAVTTLATYVDTEVAAIKAKTDNLPADPASQDAVLDAIAGIDITVENAVINTATINPVFIDDDKSWRFEAADQLDAANTLYEINGFEGLLQMDFTRPLSGGTIAIPTIVSVTPSTGLALSNPEIDADTQRKMIVTGAATAAGTYTVVLQIESTDQQTYIRRGDIIIEAP
jgi:hypothetical protein